MRTQLAATDESLTKPWRKVPPRETCAALLRRISSCRECEAHLSQGPRPVLSARPDSTILIIGQAPGAKVHASGIPWDDASGDRLREWLGVNREEFYDPKNFALVPMGFCYPGRGASGDLPPRKECQPLWHPLLLEKLSSVGLVLLVGAYAQRTYAQANEGKAKTLTETVKNFRTPTAPELPLASQKFDVIPLPHPSPLNNRWLAKNPWFATDLLPVLRRSVRQNLRG